MLPPRDTPTGQHERPRRCQRAPGIGQRTVADQVQHDVVPLPVTGEVLDGVVDDVVRADRPEQVHVPRAANTGHLRTERLGNLHGERADTASRAID
jgi:hypothetical protein